MKKNRDVRVIYRDTEGNVREMKDYAKRNSMSVSQFIRFSVSYVMGTVSFEEYVKDERRKSDDVE